MVPSTGGCNAVFFRSAAVLRVRGLALLVEGL